MQQQILDLLALLAKRLQVSVYGLDRVAFCSPMVVTAHA
jgi:hypothetical protein